MTRAAGVLLLLALAAPAWWRETNSHAAARRGSRAWEKKDHVTAAREYAAADRIEASARSAFNLGTAQVAAGERTAGATTLGKAIGDPALAADALFNRGNAALGSGALDHAIRDYSEALRRSPGHAAAKRNLEIALARRQQQSRSDRGEENGKQGDSPRQPSPAADGQRPQPGELDLDALLRSVQQQEQEELRRMKGKAARGRVGW